LLAGSAEGGAASRDLIDESITPVWEANHVWLVFILVLLWTAFPPAFAAIMTALFVPLCLSLLGIVLRGVGFAFRHTAQRLRMQQLTGAIFAASSLITPFFMGTVVGAVVTGKVPAHPSGNVVSAWTSPTAILAGFLFVAACAYISAVFLVLEAHQRGQRQLARYFSLRATAAGVVAGALAGGTFAELSTSAPYTFARLTSVALPLVAVSIAAGIVVLGMLWLRWYHAVGLRVTAAVTVATVVWGWGLAQYPYLLPTSLTLTAGSAPTASLVAELVVAGLAVLLVAPGFALLYYLQQRRMLADAETDTELRLAARLEPAIPGQPAAGPSATAARVTYAVLLSVLAIKAIRDVFSRSRRE
jgi:cytochrome d ubiquinol oxidase subunit II